MESPSRNVDSPMDLVGQCLFPVWAHQCHIVSKNLLIVNAPIKSMINVSLGDNMVDVRNGHTFLRPVRVVDLRIVIMFMAVVRKGYIFLLTVYCNEDPSYHNHVIIGNGGSLCP